MSTQPVALLCILITASLTACGDSKPRRAPDFGAAVVAGFIKKAQTLCEAARAPDFDDCSDKNQTNQEARLAAKTAMQSYATFKKICSEDLDSERCEAFLSTALARASEPSAAAK